MNTLFFIPIILIILILLYVFLIAPAQPAELHRTRFRACRFAHRGLHSKDKTVPENSLEAFRLAVEAGYGIELDIRFTKDKQLVVFHDDTLLRMCGIDKRVDEFTYKELQAFRLLGTTQGIPLFSDVLSLVAGRTPLLVELKSGAENELLCIHAYNMLKDYTGQCCIESFHPMIVRWFKKNAPEILRGQLSAPPQSFEGALSKPLAFLLSKLLLNFLARPHFIAYHKGRAPFCVRLCQRLGAMRAIWTLRDTDYADASIIMSYPNSPLWGDDMIIFEYFHP